MPLRPSLRIAVAVVALLAPASEAMAQADGVRVDPDSPAGKEYALPLDSARREAAGTPSAGAGEGAPLFGAGISKQEPRSASRDERPASGGDGGSSGGGSDTSTDRDTGASRTAAAVAETASGGPSAGLLTALIALGVLVAGGLIGLFLRARGSHQTR